jgi:hypothetical protein
MSRLWTSEVWSVKSEQQQNYRTIDQGVTSNGLSQKAHRRPSTWINAIRDTGHTQDGGAPIAFLFPAVNRKGTPVIYASCSIALAYLETIVHLGGLESLPLNRYLIRIDVPGATWKAPPPP